ncbi:hypothetical protein [Roseovarius mucosus]|uniref:hypothetical protein n=1 Tax=Roseovarius mucosus TaxID=215743 RepID=UPI003BAC6F59
MTEKNSLAFADLIRSLSERDRQSMAHDLLVAMTDDGRVPQRIFNVAEIKHASEALLLLAHNIQQNEPGGNSW